MTLVIKLTIGIMIAVTAILIGWDIYVATNNVDNALDTISGRMRIWAFSTPIIPWAWCVLAGHFFGPFASRQFMPQRISVSILVFLSWMVICAGLFLRSKGITIPPWTICIPAFLAGALLWAQ